MSKKTSDINSIGQAVMETVKDEVIRQQAEAPFKTYGSPPPPVEPSSLEIEFVEKCFELEQLGDAKILNRLFKERYLRDNGRVGGDDKNNLRYIYRFTGSYWELDISKNWLIDFMRNLGEVYLILANTYYAQVLEHYKFNKMDGIAQVKAFHKSLKGEADPLMLALVRKGDNVLSRRKKVLSRTYIQNVADIVFSGEEGLVMNGENWNKHLTWLPSANGIINCVNGELMEPRADHYFNMCLDYEYKGINEPCPVWDEMIDKVFGGDYELIDFMEYIIGAAVTGFQPKHMVISYGPKANNGKSVFFGTLLKYLKPFSCTIDVNMLLKQGHKSSSTGRPEVLRLRGKRLVVTKEADSSDVFDSGLVKDYTSGGDELTHRDLHSNAFQEFNQSHSLIIHTNNIPRIYGGDKGLAARLLVIPFYSHFIQPYEGDEDASKRIYHAKDRGELEVAFEKEKSGILAWMIRCAMKYLANKRQIPLAPLVVQELSGETMREFDIVGQFVDEQCELDGNFSIPAKELYNQFKEWCTEERCMGTKEIISMQAFGRDMKAHVERKRNRHGILYIGIKMKIPSVIF